MATTPNFADLAQQQADQSTQNTNTQTTQNRADQTTPWGSTNWTQDPTTGQWTQNTSLNPNQQTQLTNQQQAGATLTGGANALAGQATSSLSSPMDWSGFMAGGDRVNGGNYYNDAATNALKDQFNLWNNDQFGKDEEALRTQLLNRGVNPTDAGYDEQLRQLRETQGKLRTSNNLDAILNGGAEAARMQGMDINAGNYNTSQRQSQIDEALQKRNQPLTDLQNINNVAGQVTPPVMPTYNSAGRADTPDLLGAAAQTYGAQLDSKNANAAKNQSYLNAAGELFNGFGTPGGSPIGKIGSAIGGAVKGGIAGAEGGTGVVGSTLGAIKGAGSGLMAGFGGAGTAAVADGLAPLTVSPALTSAAAALGGGAGAAGAGAAGAGEAAAAGAAAGGGTGVGATLMAAAPWAAAALAAGAVIAHNIPEKSKYHDDVKFNSDGTVSLTTQFKDRGIDSAQVNAFYGPILNEFAKTGNLEQAMAKMPQPTTPQQKFLADPKQMLQLFKGTGNPFRNISMKKGYGEGPWSKGNKEIIPGMGTTRRGK